MMQKLRMPKQKGMHRTTEFIPDPDRMRMALLMLLEEPEPDEVSDSELEQIAPLAEELLAEWSDNGEE
jgi:hypothetical protein